MADAAGGFFVYSKCNIDLGITETTMRILLADDQDRVRYALRVLLAQQPGLEIVAEVYDAEDMMAQLGAVCPDLALVDWELPGLVQSGGLTAIRKVCPHVMVTVLSGRPGARRDAQAAGADAFVSKGDPPERLLAAVRECAPMR
jgi:DNA-binding NarL/FixJ family response regulator